LWNEDKELQIELVELQIEHEYLTTYHMAFIAILFGLIVGFASIYYTMYTNYTLYGNPEYLTISIFLVTSIFIYVIVIFFILWHYNNLRKTLKQRIEELKKEVRALRFG